MSVNIGIGQPNPNIWLLAVEKDGNIAGVSYYNTLAGAQAGSDLYVKQAHGWTTYIVPMAATKTVGNV